MTQLTRQTPEFPLRITKVARRSQANGTWVTGQTTGYRFDALVFAEHAEQAEYELGQSRISKLWLQRHVDDATVFNFDRGLDVGPANAEVARLVEAICERLAGLVFPNAN